jgi:hypothetical protein
LRGSYPSWNQPRQSGYQTHHAPRYIGTRRGPAQRLRPRG